MAEVQQTNTAPQSASPLASSSGSGKKPVSPFLLLIDIMIKALVGASSFLATGIMALSQAVSKINDQMSRGWIDMMDGQIGQIQQAIGTGGDLMNAKVNESMATFNLYNTMNSQSTSAYSAMLSNLGTAQAAVSQATATNTQLLQQGPIGILTILEQVV